MARYTYASNDELANIKYLPTASQTRIYDALGRDGGDDNFFVKRGKSIENAVGTTLSVLPSLVNDAIEEGKNTERNRRFEENLQNKIRNAGFDNSSDYYAAEEQAKKDAFNTVGFDWNDWSDRRSYADIAGDQEEVSRLDDEYQKAKAMLGDAERSSVNRFDESGLREQTEANAQEQQNAQRNFADYAKNSYIGQKIGQDRGKFAGSAINTLSTAFDVMAPAAGVLANSIQGGIEGIADELEQNGEKNFSWERGGQNALTGATVGAVTGGLNKGISNQLAKRGGNLFKGGNAITRGLNNLGSKTALGRAGSTLATGAARGAVSGAAGGATGAGLSAAMNGQDVLGSALQGAKQGLGQGALAGGVMAGANMVASKTPGIGTAMQKFNEAGENFNKSGDNTLERLKNTWNSGDSPVANRITEDVNAVKQGFKNVGEGVNTLAKRGMGALDDTYTQAVNRNAVERLSNALDEAVNGGAKGNTKFVRISNDLLDEFNNIRNANGLEPLSRRQVTAYENAINENLINRVREGMSTNDVAQMAFNALTSDNSKAVPGYYENQVAVSTPGMVNDYDGVVIGRTSNGDTSLKSIEPRTNSQIAMFEQTGQQKIGPKSQLGSSPVEEQPVNNSIVPQNRQNVNILPEDVQNMRTTGRASNQSPETELYRTLTGDNGGNPEQPFMAYGESGLATGKTKKQNILSKAGRAMQAAQANATRKETRDIGIESAGELIDKVRKRTGLSDIEKQAAFGKELTGGEKSLLDEVQRNAIAATEDGSTRSVDLSSLEPKINKLIDDMPNTLVSPTKKEEIRSAVFADLRNGGIDTINKANNFKSSAAQQYLINERTPNDSAKEQGKLYTKIGDLVDEASYAQVPKSQVEAMFDIAENEARARAQVAANEGRKEYQTAYNKLADELHESPRTIEAFRSLKKDYVDVAKLNKKTQQGATAWNNNPLTMGTAITAAMATGNPFAAVPAAWAAKTFAPAVGQAAIDASAKLGGKIADLGDRISSKNTGTPTPTNTTPNPTDVVDTAYNPATRVYETIGRTEGLSNAEQARTADYLVKAAQDTGEAAGTTTNTLESLATPTTASTSVYNSMYGNSYGSTPTFNSEQEERAVYFFRPTGDYWTDMLSRAMRRAKNAEDYDSLGQLYEMYQDSLSNLQKNASSTTQTKLTDKQRQANAAAVALSDFENTEPNFAYDVSDIPIIGGIANLGGNDYASKAEALALQIGYMLSGATVNKEEAKNIGMAYIPQPRDNATVRQNKINQIKGIISEYQRTYDES